MDLVIALAAVLGVAAGPPQDGIAAEVERAWAAARAAPEGPARNAELARWLDLRQRWPERPPVPADRMQGAWEGWVEAARDLRFDEALAIGRPLHAEARATWSALSLSLTLNRSGHPREADAVLGGQIEREPAVAGLWSQRGIYELANGDEAVALGYLDQAVELGSADARAVIARLDLSRERWTEAREGFREVLVHEPTHPWAARAWGVALLAKPALPGADGTRSYSVQDPAGPPAGADDARR